MKDGNPGPPKRGVAFAFDINLVSQADNNVFQETVTLAAGDIQVSKDGGQYVNLATFPPAERDLAGGADSGTLRVQLTASEMTADTVAVLFRDQAGAEWQSALVMIHTVTTSQIDDLATAAALATVDGNVDLTLVNLGGMDLKLDDILLDTGTDGVVLADDAITAATFDESTAYPLAAADTGATEVARTGADADTLETLSDQIDGVASLDDAVEGAYTLREVLRLMAAALAGKASGGNTTTITFRDLNDGTDRIVATVDADGNRTSVTLDAT